MEIVKKTLCKDIVLRYVGKNREQTYMSSRFSTLILMFTLDFILDKVIILGECS